MAIRCFSLYCFLRLWIICRKKRFPFVTVACESSRYLINIVKIYLSYFPLCQFYFYICCPKSNINELKHKIMKRKIKIDSHEVNNLYSALASFKNGYNLLPSEIAILKFFNIVIN